MLLLLKSSYSVCTVYTLSLRLAIFKHHKLILIQTIKLDINI